MKEMKKRNGGKVERGEIPYRYCKRTAKGDRSERKKGAQERTESTQGR